jgi:hypothetical protein
MLEIASAHAGVTVAVAMAMSKSWLSWLTGSAVVVLCASILGGCYVERVRPVYHHPHRVVVYR